MSRFEMQRGRKFAEKAEVVDKRQVGSAERGNLPDSAFAAVWTDANGNKQRKLPIHDAAHVRNALARFSQTAMPADVKAKAKARITAAARKFGIGGQS